MTQMLKAKVHSSVLDAFFAHPSNYYQRRIADLRISRDDDNHVKFLKLGQSPFAVQAQPAMEMLSTFPREANIYSDLKNIAVDIDDSIFPNELSKNYQCALTSDFVRENFKNIAFHLITFRTKFSKDEESYDTAVRLAYRDIQSFSELMPEHFASFTYTPWELRFANTQDEITYFKGRAAKAHSCDLLIDDNVAYAALGCIENDVELVHPVAFAFSNKSC